ncbi:MAG: hypothetical protein Q7U40_15400 [Desulfatirhabdiaceae bacterium]|nr:hypothetical protein [Desulfatirhabdiaceae bacterium]
MPFKAKEFKKAKFTYRTEAVSLPDLKDWFDGPPEWIVKGLSGNELAHCKEMAARNRKTIKTLLESLVKEQSEDVVEAVKHLTGTDGTVPMDIALRAELLVAGSVNPPCDIALALKLNMTYPIEFQQLTKRIETLTGMGYEPGKSKPSGTEPTPEP